MKELKKYPKFTLYETDKGQKVISFKNDVYGMQDGKIICFTDLTKTLKEHQEKDFLQVLTNMEADNSNQEPDNNGSENEQENSEKENQSNSNNEEEKESGISFHGNNSSVKAKLKHLKLEIVKKHFFAKKNIKKVIHWKLNEVMLNKMIKGNRLSKSRLSVSNIMDPKAQSAFNENYGKQPKKVKFNRKKKFSIGNINLQEHDIFDSKKKGSKIEKIN